MAEASAPLLEWAAAARAARGEAESGDAGVVEVAGRRALIAAVDGSGHGAEAARAADAAVAVLRAHADEDVVPLLQRCHETLAGTRGAAVTAASLALDAGTVSCVGVGNVEGRIVSGGGDRRGMSLLVHPGIVGHSLPPLHPVACELRRGDLLVLATDGVATSFADGLDSSGPPDAIAQRVLREHDRGRDDALVLVVRYLGGRR